MANNSFLNRFNIAAASSSSSETIPLSDLKIGIPHKIVTMKFIETRYGKSLLASLELPDLSNTVQVFLPKRCCNAISETDLTKVDFTKLYLKFNGFRLHNKRAYDVELLEI